jgi:Bcr/CflA subfamily drug resistance transporter
MRGAMTPPKLVTLILLTGLSTVSLNMFLPSLPNIAVDFQTDYAVVNLSIALYLAITAVVQIIIGPLSDRFGRRPVLLVAMAIFTLASLGCLLAQDIITFLVFRMLQGAVIAGSALSRAVVRDTQPDQKAASLLGYIGMAMAIAPMIGPMVGGVLDEMFGWRASFATFTGFGIVLWLLVWLDLGETHHTRSATFARQFRGYPEVLGSGRFWGYTLCMAFSTGAFFAFLAGAPLVSSVLFDMSTGTLGIFLGSITGGFFLGSFIAGRLSGHYPLTTMMIAGRVVACAGLSVGLILALTGPVTELSLFGATIFVGIGNGITMPSASAGSMSVRPDLAGSASGLSGSVTVGGGAIMTWTTGAILTPENGAYTLLGVMLAASAAGLVSALSVRWVEQS